jgi:glycerol-3-phosphate dehydrogenase
MTHQRQFLALHTPQDQLIVTGGKWAEWRKEAEHQVEQRRSKPSSNYPALLQAALDNQKQRAPRAARSTSNRAANEAEGAAQRRRQDPAAVRVQLVRDMRYLKLKRAALLALLQSEAEQQQEQQEQQQQSEEWQQEQEAVHRLKLPDVEAQLLDARWSTEQLTFVRDQVLHAAQDLAESKKQSKQRRQQHQQQEGQAQQQDESVPAAKTSSAATTAAAPSAATQPEQAPVPQCGRLARSCNLAQQSMKELSSSSDDDEFESTDKE